MLRKFLATGLAFFALTLTFNVNVYAEENFLDVCANEEGSESSPWDGTTEMPTKTVIIDGKYYYQISTAEQLAYIAQNNKDWCDNNYILTNDIVINRITDSCRIEEDGDIYLPSGAHYKEWTTIEELNGHFDGNGHYIRGLYVTNGAGLFGDTNKITNLSVIDAIVKGSSPAGIARSAVSIDNCKFEGYLYGTDYSNCNVAGIVGYATGNISNCTSDGSIVSMGEIAAGIVANGTSDAVVSNCTNYAHVEAEENAAGIMAKGYYFTNCVNEGRITGSYAGGIASTNYADIKNCTNKGEIVGVFSAGGISANAKGTISNCINMDSGCVNGSSGCACGGIVGTVSALITDCINYGDVVFGECVGGIGGKVDYNYPGTLKNCVNYGLVDANKYVGGILGYAEVYSASDNMVIDNCYNAGNVDGTNTVGGIAGYVKNYNIKQSYSAGTVTGYKQVGGVAGFSSHVSGGSLVSGCYYLESKDGTLAPFGNSASDVIGVAEAKPEDFFPVLADLNADPSYVYLGGADLLFFVNRMYEVALNRESEPAGRLNWFVALKNGTLDGAAIAGEFVLGDEFKLRGLSNEEYVDALYQTIFDREADITGKNHWLNMMASGYSREYVLAQLVNLDEFTLLCDRYKISRGVMLDNGVAVNPGIPQFVSRLYNQVLGRAPESAGLNSNVMALVVKAETAESVAKNFFGSEEYALKNTDNATYVKDLYAVFMGREADEGGLNFWVSCMTDQGASRDWVLSEFAKSEEFKIIAASYGL